MLVVVQLVSQSIGMSAGIMVAPLNDPEGKFGWGIGTIGAGLAVYYLVGAIFSPLSGWLADRYSTRLVAMVGAISFGVCLLIVARADALWQFYGLFFVAGFLGGGSMFTPLVANVGNWFTRNVGLAIGIVSAGQALGQGGVPFAAALLVGGLRAGRRGLRGAMVRPRQSQDSQTPPCQ